MYELTFTSAVVLFFFAVLLFLLTQKKRHFEYYLKSWRLLVVGCVLFVFTGGTNLLYLLSQGEHTVNLRWQQIIRAFGMVGYIASGLLILSGLIKWCGSFVEVKKHATHRLRQLTCLKSILSTVNHGEDLDQILKESLGNLVNIMGYEIGLVFRPTFHSSEMRLVAYSGVSAKNLFCLYDLYLKNMWYRESRNSQKVTTTSDVKSLPEYGVLFSDQKKIRSFACVPIKFSERVMGLIGVYDTRSDRFSFQEIQFLTCLGETLGLAAKQELVSNRNKRRREYISAIENIFEEVQASSLDERFFKLSAELKKVIDFDQVSLILSSGPRQDMKQISLGNSGGVLISRKVGAGAFDGAMEKVMRSGEVRIDRNVDPNRESSEDPLSKACGIKSRMILPLWCEEKICGALSLGSKKPNSYSAHDAKWLKPFVRTLSHIILELRLKEKLERTKSLSRSLHEFDKKLTEGEDLESLLHEATSSIASILPKSFARLTLLSKEKNRLINCSSYKIRSEGIDLRSDKNFLLEDLPWHRLALEAKRPMLVNQDDPESVMSKKEAGLILDEKVNSAFLVPLILNDRAIGIVSVGEMRSWEREPITQEDMEFVKQRAGQLCLILKKSILSRLNEQLKERLKSSEKSKQIGVAQQKFRSDLLNLSYQITNPLSLIRGSAELLRFKEANLNPESLRYLSNIENGVDRIQKTLEEFLNLYSPGNAPGLERPQEELVSG